MLNLNDREWKEYKIDDLFQIYTGTDLIISKIYDGDIPVISHAATNNGIACYSKFIDDRRLFSYRNTISLADRGNFKAFVQMQDFYIGTRVKALVFKRDVPYKALLFVSNSINKQSVKFSYGYNACDNLNKLFILLPKDENNEPDYNFMESYIREQEAFKRQEFYCYAKKIILELEYKNIPVLENKEWREFFIGGEEGIFVIKPGKRLTTSDMDYGKTPFIGSSDSNNGITNWIKTTNSTLDKNVLGVNYNGSVVENFYHGYDCIFSDDVKRLHLKNVADNKYVLLFLSTLILQQKIKYTYGYKFKESRMNKQKIIVPVNEHGKPDYEYMEHYIKNMMIQKYNSYLEYCNSRSFTSLL